MKQLYLSALTLLGFSAAAQCVPPVITKTDSPEIMCSGSTATLTITADAFEVLWYDAATGGKVLGKDNTFDTGAVPVTTSYWAEARNRIRGTAATGAKPAPMGNSSAAVKKEKDAAGLSFNANEDFILNSVDIFLAPGNEGTITIQLRDSSNKVIHTANANTPANMSNAPEKFTIPLNFDINKGMGYSLVITSGPKIIKDTKGVPFPYALGNVASITSGINNKGTDTKTYYYLYNWDYTPYTYCASERKEVTVTIDPDPPVAKAHDICFSGTVADLKAEGTNIKWYDTATGGTALPATTSLKTQTYYVSQTTNCESARIPVTVIVHAPQPPKAYAQLVCNDAKVSDLQADGINLKWYLDETGGEAFSSEEQAYNITYYVSQTVGGCESERTPVDITLKKKVPAPFVNSTSQDALPGMKLADLKGVVGENLQLYDKTAQIKLDNNTILKRGQYIVHQTVDGCISNDYFIIYINEVTELDNSFDELKFSILSNKLTITNGTPIMFAKIYNIYQDILLRAEPNSASFEFEISGLTPGTYYTEIFLTNNKRRFFKFEKK